MTDRIIEDLPGGWRGVIHDLAVTLGLAEPTPGEQEAAREWTREGPGGRSLIRLEGARTATADVHPTGCVSQALLRCQRNIGIDDRKARWAG